MECSRSPGELKHPERAGRTLQADTVLRLDHGKVQTYPWIDTFFVKCPIDKRRVFAGTIVGRLKVVTEAAAGRARFSFEPGRVRIRESLYLVDRCRRNGPTVVVADDLSHPHRFGLEVLATLC